MLALNLSTAVNTSRAALPKMLEAGGGSIVCVGTKVAYEPFSGGAAYAISKAAVLALVRSLHAEYRDDGVRANAIVPNVIDTPANRKDMPDADFDKWVAPGRDRAGGPLPLLGRTPRRSRGTRSPSTGVRPRSALRAASTR